MPNILKAVSIRYLIYIFSCFNFLFLFLGIPTKAQLLTPPTDSAEVVVPSWPEDSLGRRTPRGTVAGFIKAVANENYSRAAHYLKLDSTLRENQDGTKLAQLLQRLLDKSGHLLPHALLSNNSEGAQDDNLGPNLDRIGTATINGETFHLILEKTTSPDGGPIWQFSSQTVQRIPTQLDVETNVPYVNELVPDVLKENKWGGVPAGHWLAILVLMFTAYIVSWFLTNLLLGAVPLVWPRAKTEPTAGIVKAFGLPLRICLIVWILVAASQQVGISIIIRQQFSQVTFLVFVVAILLLLWRLTDAITRFTERRLTHRNNMAGVSAVLFLGRGAKTALIIIGAITILGSLGFDVTTGIAALGIGGLALALGAQKTIENFVGSVTLIADQPVRVGDYCKVGNTVGTVEQIGMRSTRIRTLERTIVTIPNGEFSSLQIENFAHRDKFWFHPKLTLRFETTPDQIRFLLIELRSILYAHPQVDPDPARIRFTGFGPDALNIEVFAYVKAIDFNQFLEIQEDLYLRMMEAVEKSGTRLAFPSQTLYLAKDKGVSEEKTNNAEEQVRQWREAGELGLPNFSPDQINKLHNTIPYPPEGSASK
ncbi:mechanosensitive ion channel family protein [Adhaeribacter aquaticus]|uniref:mechanosensitive ion channel family protein n=1 Tax=Adhaeribacter aquaticus TaxID=299567 RepID=UPI000422F08A|nr:mechanosensitive ion channel family protein [Adhaeribacter aquaticus]